MSGGRRFLVWNMRAFIINLDSATDRWAFIEAAFAESQLVLCRVPAVEGAALKLPHAQYSDRLYRWFHGRTPNVRELGCYLSHLKAIEAFLATDEEHGLIGEDDLILRPDFDAAIEAALEYSSSWNILRVAGLSRGRPARLVRLLARLLPLRERRSTKRRGRVCSRPGGGHGFALPAAADATAV